MKIAKIKEKKIVGVDQLPYLFVSAYCSYTNDARYCAPSPIYTITGRS